MSLAQSEAENGRDQPTRETGRFEILISETEQKDVEHREAPAITKTYKPAASGATKRGQGPSIPQFD